MNRRLSLILVATAIAMAVLACNLPNEIDPKTYTQTAVFAASATGVINLTSTSNAKNAFQTQTAFAPPTATSTPSDTPTPPPTDTPEPLGTGDAAAGGNATPQTAFGLKVGMTVTVNTTGKDQLNVRRAPSKDSAVVKTLPKGTKVTLIDGPRTVDGAHWWQIKTDAGEVGWCIEFVDNVQTLLP